MLAYRRTSKFACAFETFCFPSRHDDKQNGQELPACPTAFKKKIVKDLDVFTVSDPKREANLTFHFKHFFTSSKDSSSQLLTS